VVDRCGVAETDWCCDPSGYSPVITPAVLQASQAVLFEDLAIRGKSGHEKTRDWEEIKTIPIVQTFCRAPSSGNLVLICGCLGS